MSYCPHCGSYLGYPYPPPYVYPRPQRPPWIHPCRRFDDVGKALTVARRVISS